MTLYNSINIFEKLIDQSQSKSELKILKEFKGILVALQKKDLIAIELQSIEKNLSDLDIITIKENNKKHLRQKLKEFKKFIKEEYSFISQGYYTGIGMSLGMCFGIAIGPSVLGSESGVPLGLVFGMLIGMLIGRYKDSEAEKENRVLKHSLI